MYTMAKFSIWPLPGNGLRPVVQLVRGMAEIRRQVLSGNLSLAPATPVSVKKSEKIWTVQNNETRPLLLLFEYMNAKPKHVEKFVEFYNKKRFDVLTVNLKPWQLFFPTKGSHILAEEIAEFLRANERYTPIVYHGFSVGGYLWGEVLELCAQKQPRYDNALQRVVGQILDSGVDVTEIPTAFPAAVFPDKPFLKKTMERFIRYQMKTFYDESTRHYIAARKAFTSGQIKAPTLLIISDSDPLSTRAIAERCVKDLAAVNLEGKVKEFHGSKHVMHYQKHKEEYLQEISNFLDSLNLDLPTADVAKNSATRQEDSKKPGQLRSKL